MRGAPYLALITLAACSGDPASSSSFRVIAVDPPADATEVALDTAIVVELSAPPAADFAVSLTAATGEPISHALAIDGAIVTITPSEPLWLASDYELVVDASARAEDGESLATPFSSRFATRDGTWRNVALHAQPMMAAAPLGAGAAPSLAVLADGTALASWDGGGDLYDQKLTPDTGWLAMPNRYDVTGGDPDAVRVAAGGPAHAIAAHEKWITRANIEARTYDGTRWSAPVEVAPYTVGTTRFDQFLGGVAAAEQTYALVFHRGDFDAGFDLYAAVHANGAWSAPFLVEQLPGSASGSDIISDGRGGYVIAWTQSSADNTASAVYATTLSAAGVIGAPVQLDDGPGRTFSLSLARGGDTVWIAWAHQQGTVGMRVVARPITAAGPGPAHAIALDGASPYGEWVQIAASSRGAALVFTQYGGVSAAIAAGGTWGPTAVLDPIPMSNDEAGRPVVALDERGNATAVWTRVPASGRRTTVVARARGGRWSAPARLDEGTESTYAWTGGVDAAGRVTTAWTQAGASSYTVWAARLE